MQRSPFEIKLHDLEVEVNHLKALFDQYFQGFERRPPTRQREQFERDLRAMMREQPNNTALKFRYQTLRQKYSTLSHYWNRVLRQIEEGTYRRDIQRLRRRRAQQPSQQPRKRPSGYEMDIDLDLDLDAEIDSALSALTKSQPRTPSGKPEVARQDSKKAPKRATFAKPKAAQTSTTSSKPSATGRAAQGKTASRKASRSFPPPAKAKPKSGPGEEARMRKLYDRYVEARKRNNERVDNLKFETVAKSIRKQLPRLQKKHQGRKIDFEVVVKDGRVGLKPVVK